MAFCGCKAKIPESMLIAAFLDAAMPPGCAWALCSGMTCNGPLTDEESRYAETCHPKRAAEFRAGRACALRALSALGTPLRALGRGEDRLPVWPAGYRGSITHCGGLCLAVVSRLGATRRLGCDAEINIALPEGVPNRVLSAVELDARDQSGLPDVLWFSAKEAVFKAVFPDVRRYFGFHEAVLCIDPKGTFTATLSHSLADAAGIRALSGRWVLTHGHAITLIAA
jgi:4'-phosphopantetheinyl transferase EntD